MVGLPHTLAIYSCSGGVRVTNTVGAEPNVIVPVVAAVPPEMAVLEPTLLSPASNQVVYKVRVVGAVMLLTKAFIRT